MPPSIVEIDIGKSALDVEVRLPLSELGTALELPLANEPARTIPEFGSRIGAYVQDRLRIHSADGRAYNASIQSMERHRTSNANWISNDWLAVNLRFQAPVGSSTEVFSLDDEVIVDTVVTHKSLVYVRRDLRNGLIGDKPQAIGLIADQQTHIDVDGSNGSWRHGFTHLFTLGMEHIATGTNHLLFLLTLLLPVPLFSIRGRWVGGQDAGASLRNIVKIVTGFTLGHSLTLALGAIGWISLPSRPVEVLIALSIIISSLHAGRPIFEGKEVWIASGFGLIHGLAFAATLQGLNFDNLTLALSLLGFNLGIETMQLVVVAVTLPTILWLATTRWYSLVRTLAAAFAAVCAAAWIADRAFLVDNPLDFLLGWLTAPPAWLIALNCALSVACIVMLAFRGGIKYPTNSGMRGNA